MDAFTPTSDTESELERYRLLLEVLPSGVIDIDLRTNTFWGSPRLHEMNAASGVSLNGPMGGVLSTFHPDDKERYWTQMCAAMAAQEPLIRSVVRIQGHDGIYRWREFRFRILYCDTEPVRMVGLSTDVTELDSAFRELTMLNQSLERQIEQRTAAYQEASDERQIAEQRLRVAVDAIDSVIYIFDADERLVIANEASRRFFPDINHDESKLIGLTRAQLNARLVHYGKIPASLLPVLRPTSGMLEFELPDGRYVTVKKFSLAEGGSVTVTNDVSEVRRTQQALAEADRLAALGGLVAGVAHEINTPLGIAVTAASYLQGLVARASRSHQDETLSAQALDRFFSDSAEGAKLTLANLERAAALVRSFKQVSIDQLSDERRRIRIKTYLADVIASLKPEVRRSGHEIIMEGTDDVEILTYPGAIAQIVTNFVMNSLRHGFDDGRHGHIVLRVQKAPGQVLVTYADDGVGVDRATLRRIFEPFYTTKRGQGGTGLGLSIVRNLVIQRLGGTIESDGGPGEGLRHTIALPVQG
jgi:signal transduction histidine kinase